MSQKSSLLSLVRQDLKEKGKYTSYYALGDEFWESGYHGNCNPNWWGYNCNYINVLPNPCDHRNEGVYNGSIRCNTVQKNIFNLDKCVTFRGKYVVTDVFMITDELFKNRKKFYVEYHWYSHSSTGIELSEKAHYFEFGEFCEMATIKEIQKLVHNC